MMAKHSIINNDNIPDELKARNQWVWWRAKPKADGKSDKIPMDPKNGKAASHSNPETWTSFEQATQYHESHANSAGIGFVFSKDDPYVGIDLDNCRDPETGHIESWAQEFLELADTYSEISPSGTGVKMFLKGKMSSEKGRKRAYKTGAVEIYEHSRFFTVTGRRLGTNDAD